ASRDRRPRPPHELGGGQVRGRASSSADRRRARRADPLPEQPPAAALLPRTRNRPIGRLNGYTYLGSASSGRESRVFDNPILFVAQEAFPRMAPHRAASYRGF